MSTEPDKANRQTRRSLGFARQFRSTRSLTTALHERDEHTGDHCDRVALLAEWMGRALGLNRVDMSILRLGGRFHDVGKIGIPDEVLLKKSRFTDREWEIMKTHAEKGDRIIQATGLPGAARLARAIRHHHENYDGSGYPDGLRGDAIPLVSQIISIVDAYDAMRTVRPYRQPMSQEKVLSILESESTWKFAPRVFERFRAIVGRIPASCA